jgi:thermitase
MDKLWIRWLVSLAAIALFFLNPQFSVVRSLAAEGNLEAQVLVKYKYGLFKPTKGGRVVGTIDGVGVRQIQYHSYEEAAAAAVALHDNFFVEYAEVNTLSVRTLATPNDTRYSSQWHLPKISAPSAWDHQQGVTSTIIAVIDTGIKGNHADLSGKVLAGKGFVGSSTVDFSANSDSDPCGHGTAVAGLAAASTNNSVGVAGVDWNARLMPIQVIDDSAQLSCQFGFVSDLVEAIIYAADAGAKIINVSLGTSDFSQSLRDAVVYARNKGSMVVAAAGNGGSLLYPAGFSEAIAVGATDENDVLASFSSTGSELDLVAPGVSVHTTCDHEESDLSCTSGTPYANFSGTSAATPIVSGALGLALARNPGMVGADFLAATRNGVDKVAGMGGANFTHSYGYGRLNAFKLIWGFQHYSAQWISQNGYPTIPRGQSYKFSVTFKNTGKSTWYRNDPFVLVNLGTDRSRDRIPGWIREGGSPSGWRSPNRVELTQATVAPSANGTFEFWYTAPPDKGLGIYREYFRPVADGWDWLEDYGVYWDVTVPTLEEQYRHTFVSQNFHSKSVTRNEAIEFVVSVKNTGSITWQQGVVNLGTDRGRDRVPGWIREGSGPSGWLKDNRIRMEQGSVAPGGTASFRFWMTTPPDKAAGTFREYFRLVADGITWMEDYGIYWDLTVVP